MAVLAAAAFMAFAMGARSQDIEPRAYSNAPIGVNFLVAGYAYTRGGIAFDTSLPIANPNLHTSNAVLGYARVVDFWGTSGKIDVLMPYTWLSGSATYAGERIDRVVNGFADPAFRVSVNLYGAPALTLPEFADWQQDLIVGVSLRVSAPWGQYDDSRVVNIGANRWAFKPEVGVSKAVGPWTLEVTAAALLFTDNDDSTAAAHALAGPALCPAGPRYLQLPLRHLGLARRHLLQRRPNHDRRHRGPRSAAELACRRDAVVPGRPQQLGQGLREQRGVGAHGQQLRPGRDRVAVSLGRRTLNRFRVNHLGARTGHRACARARTGSA